MRTVFVRSMLHDINETIYSIQHINQGADDQQLQHKQVWCKFIRSGLLCVHMLLY